MNDEDFMLRAIHAGRRTRGATGANPAVGCVIVKEGDILAAAATAEGGRPHAETIALGMAAEAARGATAYITLEPCCHHGRTPPCADALIEAGITRVVTGEEDPDPRVSGGGHGRLREAGIEVVEHVLRDEVRHELRGFLCRFDNKRAYVTLKLAISADGKIAERPGQPTAITGPEVKARVHLLRARVDAIMVGVSTVLADDPELTCRLTGLLGRSPVRIASDSCLSIPLGSKLVKSARQVPVWVMTLETADAARAAALEAEGVEVIRCNATADGKVDLADLLQKLAERGIGHVLAEGGAHMARALMEADLVDEALLFTSPAKIGPTGLDAMAGLPLDTIRASSKFRSSAKNEKLGADWLARYLRVR